MKTSDLKNLLNLAFGALEEEYNNPEKGLVMEAEVNGRDLEAKELRAEWKQAQQARTELEKMLGKCPHLNITNHNTLSGSLNECEDCGYKWYDIDE